MAKGCCVIAQKTALVIDDHPLVARGIAAFLQSHCGFDHVHAITNIEDLWSYIDSNFAPSMIVLDFWLSAGPSLTLLSQIKMKCLTTPVLVVSADDDIAVQNKVRATGAHGFIHKQEAPDIFAQAVASLLNGKTWFVDTNQRRKPANQLNELPITAADLGLTVRQGEILAMVMKGLPNKRIAQLLSLSEQTVKEHVTGILGKLGVSNRIQAITKLRGKRLE
jgi:DNA-binding NarL/FixJ family response regulator